MSGQTSFKDKTEIKVRKPCMYRVVLINDDYTTMDFVVEVLVVIFHKSPTEATGIMLDVHEKGKGIVGIYTYDIARTRILQVEEMARDRDFPLKAVMEEE